MKIFQLIRTAFGLFLSIAITLGVSLWTLVLKDKDGPNKWSRLIHDWIAVPIVNISERTEENFGEIGEDELVVVYANHQSSAALSEFNRYVIETFGRTPVYIVKDDLYPWVLWPIDRIGIAVKINRNSPLEAARAIQKALPEIIERKQVIVIFPDSSRWTSKRAAEQREKFAGTPQAEEILIHTLMPRAGGLFQIIDAIGDRSFRLFEVANGFDLQVENLPQAIQLYGTSFCAMSEEIDPSTLPSGKGDRREWLNNRFLKISRKLGVQRQTYALYSRTYASLPAPKPVSEQRKQA